MTPSQRDALGGRHRGAPGGLLERRGWLGRPVGPGHALLALGEASLEALQLLQLVQPLAFERAYLVLYVIDPSGERRGLLR